MDCLMKKLFRTFAANTLNFPTLPLRFFSGRQMAFCAILAMMLTGGMMGVKADTITFTNVITAGGATLPQFDPANGQLAEINLWFAGTFTVTGNLHNNTGINYNSSVWFNIGYSVFASGTGMGLKNTFTEIHSPSFYVPANSNAAWSANVYSGLTDIHSDLPTDLEFFTGTGFVNALEHVSFADVDSVWSNPADLAPVTASLSSAYLSSGTVYLSYSYVAVPEPSMFALLGLGTAAMMIFRRRK
jgi:hypothetical protein